MSLVSLEMRIYSILPDSFLIKADTRGKNCKEIIIDNYSTTAVPSSDIYF